MVVVVVKLVVVMVGGECGAGQHEDERAETRAGARAGAERCGKDVIFASSVLYRSQGHVWLGEETC